jgi:hypothetical protein
MMKDNLELETRMVNIEKRKHKWKWNKLKKKLRKKNKQHKRKERHKSPSLSKHLKLWRQVLYNSQELTILHKWHKMLNKLNKNPNQLRKRKLRKLRMLLLQRRRTSSISTTSTDHSWLKRFGNGSWLKVIVYKKSGSLLFRFVLLVNTVIQSVQMECILGEWEKTTS